MGYTGELPEYKKYDKKGKLIEPEDNVLDKVHKMMNNLPKSSCFRCKHLNTDEISCKAFPRIIPREILLAQVPHNKPYEGDNGIQFEEKSKK